MRFLFLINLVMCTGVLYLCISHIIKYISKGSNYKILCDTYYPCAFFYSHFPTSFGFAYSTTIFIFFLVGWFLSTYEWIQFDEEM